MPKNLNNILFLIKKILFFYKKKNIINLSKNKTKIMQKEKYNSYKIQKLYLKTKTKIKLND
jgi:hypothetical protein